MSNNTRNHFPRDVVINILLRLPVKSLNRFICVCKSWYEIIKNNTFIQNHHHNRENLLLLLCDDSDNDRNAHSTLFKMISNDLTTFVDQDFFHTLPFDSYNYSINGHCNGLFCLSGWNTAALWNPANTEIKLLPQFPREYKHSDYEYYGLRLGWDQRTNDYKVLVFLREDVYDRDDRDYPQYVYIYSLNNDSWRRLKGNVPQHDVDASSDLCLDGIFYWFYYDDRLLSFHISDEVFEEIIAPDCLKSHEDSATLDKYNGHVAIIVSDILCSAKSIIDIWVLISENRWSKAVSMTVPFTNCVFPLGVWENGEVILDGRGCIHIYDPRTQQLHYEVVRTDGFCLKRSYKESLVSVKKMPQDFSDVFNIADLFM